MKTSILKFILLVAFINLLTIFKVDASTLKSNNDTINFTVIKFVGKYHYMFDSLVHPTDLSKQDILVLQNILQKAIDEHNKFLDMDSSIKSSYLKVNLSKYKRQFVAVKNSNREKQVYVSCICSSEIEELKKSKINWKTDIFKINDGGICYFSLYINLTNNTYHNLIIEGHP